jgi:tetratricopeptide (TPR) repeat protein
LVNALAYRAMSRQRQHNLDGAEVDLTEALRRQPDKVAYLFLRAEVRRKLGKAREAAEDEQAGQAQEPDDEWGFAVRGRYRTVPDAAEVIFHAARVEADLERAIADYDRALAINSRNQSTLRNKACALERLNRTNEAIGVYAVLLSYYPDLLAARATRGVLLARMGRVQEAVADAKVCEKAATLTPFMAYQLGSLYAMLSGQDTSYKNEALRLLATSLELGLNRTDLFRTDADLNPIRKDAQFRKLADSVEQAVTIRSQLAQP